MTPRYDFLVLGIRKVVDGDTCDLVIDVGFRTVLVQRIRLAVVDTPERGQPGYHEATDFARHWLHECLAAGVVRVRTYKEESFGRWVADVYDVTTGETLSSALLRRDLGTVWS